MSTTLSIKTLSAIEFAADLFRAARRVVVLSGAGFSTPSDIPDFRSTGSGLWAKDEPMEVASLSTFRVAPEKFFSWFRPLASQIFNALPNPAHIALAKLEEAGHLQSILTQNIDVLHQKSGSKNVVELHGTLNTLSCTQCYFKASAERFIKSFVDTGNIPHCPQCNAILKPDVILFGEQLPQSAWFAAQKEARQCDLMVIAGSSLEVMPVAGLPIQALDRGAHLIIINNSPTYLNIRADVIIQDDLAEVFPAIAEKIFHG